MPEDEIKRVKDLLAAFSDPVDESSGAPDPAVFEVAVAKDRGDRRVLAKLIGDALSNRS